MIVLLEIYFWAICAGAFAALALGMLGCWVAARDRAMQTLCLGQGATFGVLFGLGITPYLAMPGFHRFGALVLAIVSAMFSYEASNRMVRKHSASKNTYYSFLFTALVGLSYLVSALFPSLETHMSHIFFGDLATLSDTDSVISIVLGILGSILMWRFRRPFTNQAFEMAIFGMNEKERFGRQLFKGTSFIAICYSVQYLGFLFTMACLFIPTSLVSYLGVKGLHRHLALSAALSVLATLLGFIFSLSFTQFPTVPTIVCFMVLLGGAAGLSQSLRHRG